MSTFALKPDFPLYTLGAETCRSWRDLDMGLGKSIGQGLFSRDRSSVMSEIEIEESPWWKQETQALGRLSRGRPAMVEGRLSDPRPQVG